MSSPRRRGSRATKPTPRFMSENNLQKKVFTKLEKIFTQLNSKKYPTKLAIAVSGGCDSLSLAILLNKFCQEKNIKLFAVTIDHKIRQSSSTEALQLGKILAKEKITHEILEIKWQKTPTANIESKLREVRYQMLQDHCIENKIKFLFLGHQLDDVAENFLIRLFRGSGMDGLSSIAEILQLEKIQLIRPLLDITKDELKIFLQAQEVKWIEDESNNDEKFLRNKIRKFLNSFEDKNLIQKRIKNTADEMSKMRDSFDEEMLARAKEILKFEDNKLYLNLEKFKKIEEKIALKILALMAIEASGKAYKPRLEKLKIFYNWILTDPHHKPYDFYGCATKKVGVMLSLSKHDSGPQITTTKQTNKQLRTILKRIF